MQVGGELLSDCSQLDQTIKKITKNKLEVRVLPAWRQGSRELHDANTTLELGLETGKGLCVRVVRCAVAICGMGGFKGGEGREGGKEGRERNERGEREGGRTMRHDTTPCTRPNVRRDHVTGLR